MNKQKTLRLEDSSTDADLIHRVLIKGNLEFERLLIFTKEEYLRALNTFKPDIILCDHSLPYFKSYHALEILEDPNINTLYINHCKCI
jgi:CheY-like chemotaxis protein